MRMGVRLGGWVNEESNYTPKNFHILVLCMQLIHTTLMHVKISANQPTSQSWQADRRVGGKRKRERVGTVQERKQGVGGVKEKEMSGEKTHTHTPREGEKDC